MTEDVDEAVLSEQILGKFICGFCSNAKDGLDERWRLMPVDLYEVESHEVVGGLLARQVSLATELAQAPQVWTRNSAPLFLRAMTEVLITLRWILISVPERTRLFYLYGLGQHKLQTEHLKERLIQDPDNEDIKIMVEASNNWLEAQRREFFTDVDVGAWAGKSVREMANESGSEELYKFAYSPFSSSVHSTWDHIGKHNVEYCENIMHKFHRLPVVPQDDPEVDYLYRAAKYLNMTFLAVDEHFEIKPVTPAPKVWFSESIANMKELNEKAT